MFGHRHTGAVADIGFLVLEAVDAYSAARPKYGNPADRHRLRCVEIRHCIGKHRPEGLGVLTVYYLKHMVRPALLRKPLLRKRQPFLLTLRGLRLTVQNNS
jgi:hypothetical protein